MVSGLQILLSFLSTSGLCAGAEILSEGKAIWCPRAEDAVYTYVANEYDHVEYMPRKFAPYVLDWNDLLFKNEKYQALSRDIYFLRQNKNSAGVMIIEKFSVSATGEIFKIESRYNLRGQLVYARVT